MPIVFWSVVLGGAVAITFALNRRTRKKHVNLAAHMAQSGIADPGLARRAGDSMIALAADIQNANPPHAHEPDLR